MRQPSLDVLLVGAVGLDEAELVGVPAVGTEALEHVSASTQLVSPSIWMRLASKITVRLPSFWLAAGGSGLAGDALLDVAFTADGPDLVVERESSFGVSGSSRPR